MRNIKLINLKGDLFASAFTFSLQAIIKFCSSLILTRILRPESYGVITIVMSIVFIVEMVADLGVTVFIVRDKHGETPRYLNTAWTLRFCRNLVSATLLFAFAQVIASLYGISELGAPLRVFSLWFVIGGLESMSYQIAIRRKQSRRLMYSELGATFLSTLFAIFYCYISRDYWGMLYATLLAKLFLALMSRQFYRELTPKFQFDRAAAREMFQLTRYILPSSFLSMILSQFDKVIFLRFFDLGLLGLYGLAGGIAGPVEALVSNISRMVLYPRCAHNFRDNEQTYALKYYTENVRLFVSMLTLPAAVWGAAHLIILFLYPSRYAQSTPVLQAFMLRASLLALASPAEEMLVATGESRLILIGNLFRGAWMVTASIAGFYLFGFTGFIYGAALSGLPPFIYYLWMQHKKGMLIAKYELYRLAYVVILAVASYVTSSLLLSAWPNFHLRS